MHKNKGFPSPVSTVGSPISSRTDVGEMVEHVVVRVNERRLPSLATQRKERTMLLRKKLEEVNLHQAVKDKMAVLQGEDSERFIMLCRLAHIDQFGSALDNACFTQEWLNYKISGIVPSFVERFVLQ